MKNTFSLQATVWVYPGKSAWRFITVSKKVSKEIKNTYAKVRRGWGAIPVTVTLGTSRWETSIFPDAKSGSYLLPLKASVRKKEKIDETKKVAFEIAIRVDSIANKIR